VNDDLSYLRNSDPELDLYDYRPNSRGRRQKPYLWRTYPHNGLLQTLQHDYGGGAFDIMIRDGSTMLLSGRSAVAPIPERPDRT